MPRRDPRRRDPRLDARCPATIAFGAGRWEGETEDLGPTGCRIVALFPLRRGEAVALRLRHRAVPFELRIAGTVAWTAPAPPYRTGVAFAKGQVDEARRFVRAVRAADPSVGEVVGVPPDPQQAAEPAPERSRWATFAMPRLGSPSHATRTLPRQPAPSHGVTAPPPRTAPPTRAADGARWARARPPEAQRLLDEARREAGAGRTHAAIAALREALLSAPGDAEIAAVLGALAFRGRKREA